MKSLILIGLSKLLSAYYFAIIKRIYFHVRHGKIPKGLNFNSPKTFNEKINYLKLYNKPNIDINIQAQHLTLEIIEIDNIIIICIEIIKVKPETEEIIVLSKFSYNIHTGEEVPYPLDEDDDE